jgi:SAM-dependent methyltransferase
MPDKSLSKHLGQMREDWERRALENARHYVLTGQAEWTDEEFFRAGQQTLREEILNDLPNICQGRDPRDVKVLEIGCGAGRVTRAFAGFFGYVYAVDISREMVRQARKAVTGFPNVHIFQNNGTDLSVVRDHWWNRLGIGRVTVDFAFSCLVFQHIPSRDIIENYVREAGRLLRPGGLFKFQIQGCPVPESEIEGSWVGVSFSEEEAREMAARTGFEMRYHYGAGDQYFWLWFFKK